MSLECNSIKRFKKLSKKSDQLNIPRIYVLLNTEIKEFLNKV